MGIPLIRQLYAMTYAVVCGLLCGAVYDVFRLVRVFFGITEHAGIGNKLYGIAFPLIGTIHRPMPGRIIRAAHLWVVFFGDILFALSAGCIFNVFLYVAASGCFRWFYLLFSFIGFLAYYFTIGRLTMMASDFIVCVLRVCLCYGALILTLPFRIVWKALKLIWHHVLLRVVYPIRQAIYLRQCRRYTAQIKIHLFKQIRV